MSDLFTYADELATKTARNWKAPGTSARAAQGAARYATGNFLRIREALAKGPMTPDEVARETGINLLTARPRMSDLANPRVDGVAIAPFIVPAGFERSTSCGKSAAVMRLATDDERAAWGRE